MTVNTHVESISSTSHTYTIHLGGTLIDSRRTAEG